MGRLFTVSHDSLLEGPLLKKITLFVIPLMISNLLQVCYNAADMIIVGLSGVEGAIGSIGTTNSFIHLTLNIFMGFSIGANVVVARNLGKGDREAAEHSVHTSLLIGLFSGIICAGIGISISRTVLAFLGDEGHILDLATLYAKIYFAGAPLLSLTNFMMAILRAEGDTNTPLAVLTISGLCNVALNLLFVLVFHMSVDGVAWATVLSNLVSVILLGIRLMNDEGLCRVSLKKLRIHVPAMREIFREGLPAGLQGAVFSLSNMLIQSTIIGINNTVCPGGSGIIDGNAAGASLENFAYTATNSVYQASVTFTSQHYGARMYRRIGTVMRDCYLITFCIAFLSSAILVGFRTPLIGLYVDSETAFRAAETRIFTNISVFELLAFMEVGSGVLRGMGKSFISTCISLTGSCLFRIAWILIVFPMFPTLRTVYLSYPLSWALTGAAHLTVSLLIRRRLIRQQEAVGGIGE